MLRKKTSAADLTPATSVIAGPSRFIHPWKARITSSGSLDSISGLSSTKSRWLGDELAYGAGLPILGECPFFCTIEDPLCQEQRVASTRFLEVLELRSKLLPLLLKLP